MANSLGRGGTVTFGTSGFTAEFTDFNWSGISREPINTSNMGTTTAHTFRPSGLYDAGELTLSGHWNGTETVPITGAAETITIDWAGSGNTSGGSGFMTGFSISASGGESDALMTFEMTIKFSGTVTI